MKLTELTCPDSANGTKTYTLNHTKISSPDDRARQRKEPISEDDETCQRLQRKVLSQMERQTKQARVSIDTSPTDSRCDTGGNKVQHGRQTCKQRVVNLQLEQCQESVHGALPWQHLENHVPCGVLHNQSCESADISRPCTHERALKRSTRSTYGRVCLRKGERVEPPKRVAMRLSRIGTKSCPSLWSRGHAAGDNAREMRYSQEQYGGRLLNSLDLPGSKKHFGHTCQNSVQSITIDATLKSSTAPEKSIKTRPICPSPLDIKVQTEPVLSPLLRIKHVNSTRRGSSQLSPGRSSVLTDKNRAGNHRSKLQESLFARTPSTLHTDQRQAQLVPSLRDLLSHPLLLPGSSALRTDALTTIPIFDDEVARQIESRSGKQLNKKLRLKGDQEDLQAHSRCSTAKPHGRQKDCEVRGSSLLRQSSWVRTFRVWCSTASTGKQLHHRRSLLSGPIKIKGLTHTQKRAEGHQMPKLPTTDH